MKDVPRSAQFNDIYFSVEDGLAETAHVFLDGNDLPNGWTARPDIKSFTIAEAGFGTGLNFLSAWKLFDETAMKGQCLDFISIEKYPLSASDIKAALSQWSSHFGNRLNRLCDLYPLRVDGFHRLQLSPSVSLTLIFDDINNALPQLDGAVDCWFLDGFTPAKNPEMWRPLLFDEMRRLSKRGARVATFTAAGDVRRGLEQAGFSIEKKKGFGRKREMLTGIYKGAGAPSLKAYDLNAKIAIIGGGLAGTSCAYALKELGYSPEIYEASGALATGGSGNKIGLYNPRFSKQRDMLSDFFAPAYARFIQMAKQAGDLIDYTPCGALHLMNEETKANRYAEMAKNWGWHSNHVSVLTQEEASAVAGIDLPCGALYLPDSGSVSPQKLCEYYARDIPVHYHKAIDNLDALKADIIILACGAAVQKFAPLSWLSLDNIRGQVSYFNQTKMTRNLKCHILHGGYLSSPQHGKKGQKGQHVIGSTFEKWVDHSEVTDENHAENLQKLKENLPALKDEDILIHEGRAGMRAATNDRFPVVGAVPHHPGLYVSAAFGSHGLVASIIGAHLIADMISGRTPCLPKDTVYQLSPRRFLDRAAKKGRVLI